MIVTTITIVVNIITSITSITSVTSVATSTIVLILLLVLPYITTITNCLLFIILTYSYYPCVIWGRDFYAPVGYSCDSVRGRRSSGE